MLRINSKTARCYQHRTALHRFLLPDCSERYNQLEHLNYIISEALWQGVLFLYLFLPLRRRNGHTKGE